MPTDKDSPWGDSKLEGTLPPLSHAPRLSSHEQIRRRNLLGSIKGKAQKVWRDVRDEAIPKDVPEVLTLFDLSSTTDVDGLREIQALKRLNPHPHIVDLIDVVLYGLLFGLTM
jgi:hypothetical protein